LCTFARSANIACFYKMKKLFTLSIALFFALFSIVWAQIPFGYYDSAEGKSGAALKTALHTIISYGHIELPFDGTGANVLWWWNSNFRNTDWHPPTESHPEGFFWDKYSLNRWTTYQGGSVQNREHALPRSWWARQTVPGGPFDDWGFANGDLFNLFPADQPANAAKSNFPLGEVNRTTQTFFNQVVRVGPSTISSYNGPVFEPPDQYKGDFARTYMYMVTRYEDFADPQSLYRWRSVGIQSMIANPQNRFPAFSEYGIYIVMKWHRLDPVSQKEIDRNNAVHRIQNNRNPFIDHPELAEHLWGNLRGQAWRGSRIVSEFGVAFDGARSMLEISVTREADEIVRYEIYSITGQLALSGELNHSNVRTNNTNLELPINLNSGMYIVVVYSDAQRHTARFFVSAKKN